MKFYVIATYKEKFAKIGYLVGFQGYQKFHCRIAKCLNSVLYVSSPGGDSEDRISSNFRCSYQSPEYGYGIRTRSVPVPKYGNGNVTGTGRFRNYKYGYVTGTGLFLKSGYGNGT